MRLKRRCTHDLEGMAAVQLAVAGTQISSRSRVAYTSAGQYCSTRFPISSAANQQLLKPAHAPCRVTADSPGGYLHCYYYSEFVTFKVNLSPPLQFEAPGARPCPRAAAAARLCDEGNEVNGRKACVMLRRRACGWRCVHHTVTLTASNKPPPTLPPSSPPLPPSRPP